MLALFCPLSLAVIVKSTTIVSPSTTRPQRAWPSLSGLCSKALRHATTFHALLTTGKLMIPYVCQVLNHICLTVDLMFICSESSQPVHKPTKGDSLTGCTKNCAISERDSCQRNFVQIKWECKSQSIYRC